MNQPVIDYFRCPEKFVDFRLTGTLSAEPGFFAFGPRTICYGSVASGSGSRQVTDPLHDALADVTTSGGSVGLPLSPAEIVENLRRERYCQSANRQQARLVETSLARAVYYGLRPYLPASARKHLQRLRLSDWRTLPFPQWPVDRTVERILERLLFLSMKAQGIQRVPFVWFWPEAAGSCAIMTHDVEYLAGRNFCSSLMDLDDAAGIKSSFQLVPEQRYPVPDALLDEIRTRGFEVNIHDLNHDGGLFGSREEFLRRVVRINEHGRRFGALGFRASAMYRNQDWFDALEFSYDMSVPSVAHLEPQRGGCCSQMPFFVGKILELPLTVVEDYSLFHILNDYTLDPWRQQIDLIAETHGLASFIVHPDYVIEKRAQATYRALLQYLVKMREERAMWVALPCEVDRWWRERSRMTVVHDGNLWRIVGAGRERARLAFATLAGDGLAFTVEARA